MAAPTPDPRPPGDSLAFAVIASSNAPVLVLDGNLDVVASSGSFSRTFEVDPSIARGNPVFKMGAGEWDVPQLRSLLKATVAGHAEVDAYEMDLKRDGKPNRRLVLNAQRLEYADSDSPRLLLAVSDVTDARQAAKLQEDLLREKAILLQELQHRVANSLQIIASVLMQSSKRVTSDETRSHLQDAHNRVVSVAAVQRQLAASTLGDVELCHYFTDLCQSIGASMIRDPKQLSLEVVCDKSMATADISVSLGLIVTELVINSLKHAFPGRRKGKITVEYKSHGTAWTLTVADDGVGFPADAASAKPGLGTSIVEALAKQLNARVKVASTTPGASVAIIHPAT